MQKLVVELHTAASEDCHYLQEGCILRIIQPPQRAIIYSKTISPKHDIVYDTLRLLGSGSRRDYIPREKSSSSSEACWARWWTGNFYGAFNSTKLPSSIEYCINIITLVRILNKHSTADTSICQKNHTHRTHQYQTHYHRSVIFLSMKYTRTPRDKKIDQTLVPASKISFKRIIISDLKHKCMHLKIGLLQPLVFTNDFRYSTTAAF